MTPDGQEQGPFLEDQMTGWHSQGYFPAELLIRPLGSPGLGTRVVNLSLETSRLLDLCGPLKVNVSAAKFCGSPHEFCSIIFRNCILLVIDDTIDH